MGRREGITSINGNVNKFPADLILANNDGSLVRDIPRCLAVDIQITRFQYFHIIDQVSFDETTAFIGQPPVAPNSDSREGGLGLYWLLDLDNSEWVSAQDGSSMTQPDSDDNPVRPIGTLSVIIIA